MIVKEGETVIVRKPCVGKFKAVAAKTFNTSDLDYPLLVDGEAVTLKRGAVRLLKDDGSALGSSSAETSDPTEEAEGDVSPDSSE